MTNYSWVREILIVNEYYSEQAQKKVNEALRKGWKLLSITQTGVTNEGISTYYTLGK